MSGTLPLFSHGDGGGSAPGAPAVAQRVEALLASSPGPWTAAAIRKQWPARPAPKPAVIEAALEELQARRAAHRLPGARGAELWSATPLEGWLEEAERRLMEMVRAAGAPTPEKKLLSALWPKGLDPQPLSERLVRLEREGRLRRWPGKTVLWWHLGPEEALGEALLSALGDRAMERARWLREARTRLRGPSAVQWQQAAADLIASGRVVAHAAKIEGKKVEVCAPAEHRAALLDVYRPVLARLVEEWRRLGIRQEEIRRFLAFEPPAAARTDELLAELRRLERESPPPNPVARLRRRAALQQLSKEEFDRAALDLLRQGRVYMAPHDHPARLAAADREELVTDGAGTFYVSISARP